MKKYPTSYVLVQVWHNEGDTPETILRRVGRGLAGFAGMEKFRVTLAPRDRSPASPRP